MSIEINEPVKVGAVFSQGEIRLVWFSWNGKPVRISETTFVWKTWEGSARILHFTVTDGRGLYEISFNRETLGWRLLNAECGV